MLSQVCPSYLVGLLRAIFFSKACKLQDVLFSPDLHTLVFLFKNALVNLLWQLDQTKTCSNF